MNHLTLWLELRRGKESRLMPVQWHSSIQAKKKNPNKNKREEKTLNVFIGLVRSHPSVTQQSSVTRIFFFFAKISTVARTMFTLVLVNTASQFKELKRASYWQNLLYSWDLIWTQLQVGRLCDVLVKNRVNVTILSHTGLPCPLDTWMTPHQHYGHI